MLEGGIIMSCNNNRACPCPKTDCENNGVCCACIAKHVGLDGLPFCAFPKEGDKSLKLFYEKLKERFEEPVV